MTRTTTMIAATTTIATTTPTMMPTGGPESVLSANNNCSINPTDGRNIGH